jgi:4-oxalmesaconate hydratase
VNDLIYRQVQMFPTRFRGVAGLPQHRDDSPANCVDELERCVKELGFVGCLLNPDPTEGETRPPPGLGDPFWYPLYEKLVELDVPALVHSASSCHPRESYTLKFLNEESIAIMSLLDSTVFEDFPTLKIVIAHGGGAIPYHMGRFRAWHHRQGRPGTFDQRLRKLYFDTCNYSREALEFQFRIVGTDNCLFGTERPGTGSVVDPQTGKEFDHLRPIVESIEWLTPADRQKIFEGNTRKVYTKI